jgi:hypothetical protein
MLLAAWEASLGIPAYTTSAIEEVLGRPARAFRESVVHHVADFETGPRPDGIRLAPH